MDEQPRLSDNHLLQPAAAAPRTTRKFAVFPAGPAEEAAIKMIEDSSHGRLVEMAIKFSHPRSVALYRSASSFKPAEVCLGSFHSRISLFIRFIAAALTAGRKPVRDPRLMTRVGAGIAGIF